MIQLLNKFLLGYGYGSLTELFHSLCPSFKYNLQMPVIYISSAITVVSYYLGLTPLLACAMLIAVVTETVSGIVASKKRGEDFESFKFSRCVLKVFIWMVLIFIANAFALECDSQSGWIYSLGRIFFDVVHILTLAYFAIEYIVSILENLAVIDGKPKTEFIKAVESAWKVLSKNLKKHV